jgi:type II secretory pathway component PulF
MAEFPRTFSPLYQNLVKIGEQTGSLALIFDRLSKDLNFQAELRSKIVEALTYPLVILAVCIVSILFVFNYIVPQMGGLFDGMESLPVYTTVLLETSAWFQQYQWWLLVGIGGLVAGLVATLSNPEAKARLLDFMVEVPGIRNAFIKIESVRFNAAVAMMCAAGMAIDKAVLLACESVGSGQLRRGLLAAQQKVRKGEALSNSLQTSPLFPDFSIALIEVGEESGDLVPVFEELASRARSEFESWVLRFASLLEPLLIIVMGGIVGAVVVTMLLSIVSVNDLGV